MNDNNNYVKPILEIIMFDDVDIITTSGNEGNPEDNDID